MTISLDAYTFAQVVAQIANFGVQKDNYAPRQGVLQLHLCWMPACICLRYGPQHQHSPLVLGQCAWAYSYHLCIGFPLWIVHDYPNWC